MLQREIPEISKPENSTIGYFLVYLGLPIVVLEDSAMVHHDQFTFQELIMKR